MERNCKNATNNKNKGKDDIFHELNRHYIRMKKKEKKQNTLILFSVLKELIRIMRSNDKLFDSLKPKLDFLGSYFDRLRVGKPTEYDINVILTFPINYGKIKLDATNCQHDYTAIIMPSEFRRLLITPATADKGFTKTQMWCDKNYRLSVTKFRAWMQSTVDTAIHTLPLESGQRILKVKNKCYGICSKISGPANTIKIIKEDDSVIDIDLVPSFSFQLPMKPLNSKIDFSKVELICPCNINYFVVPKPSTDDFSWRVSFPYQERYFLRNKYYLKATIRLLKHFRDVQGFTKLSSYYIKTLFLWECQESDENIWQNKSLSYLVLMMLTKLMDSLRNNRISNFWCPTHNLIEKIKAETCQNWYHRISFIIRQIVCSSNSNQLILEYFLLKKS